MSEATREAFFADVGKTHQLCRFPETGEWSLRVKQIDDVAHVRYLNEGEVALVEGVMKAAIALPSEPDLLPGLKVALKMFTESLGPNWDVLNTLRETIRELKRKET